MEEGILMAREGQLAYTKGSLLVDTSLLYINAFFKSKKNDIFVQVYYVFASLCCLNSLCKMHFLWQRNLYI